ncbi:MAG: methyl-accepting chemotaxis protein [Myxococcaceae bacterium]|jgi:methyl-accepting chemotaxis protein|nr:methyl-accepting chemotaxis protein [Myxococcaceae bacterium]
MTAAAAPRRERVVVDRDQLEALMDVMRAAARGDLEPRVAPRDDGSALDELGALVNGFLDVADAFVREATGSLSAVAKGRFHRRLLERGMPGTFRRAAEAINRATEHMQREDAELRRLRRAQLELADGLEARVGQVAEDVARAVQAQSGAAKELASAADEGSRLTHESAANVGHVQQTLQQVDVGTQALVVEADAITSRVSVARDGVATMRSTLGRTEAAIASMSDQTQAISRAVTAIAQVAAQTRMLAVNATIEAARVGEFGKGFRVVATEVKKLATEAAAASDDIAAQVAAIGAATTAVRDTHAEAMESVVSLEGAVKGITESVAAQHEGTRAMASTLTKAVAGSRELSLAMTAIASGAEETSRAAEQVRASSATLSESSDILSREVRTFLGSVREQAGGEGLREA